MMNIRRIFLITIALFILQIIARSVITAFPVHNSAAVRIPDTTFAEPKNIIDNHWAYYIINRENPLDKDFTVELKNVQGRFMLDARCADYAVKMIEDARADGIELCVVSAYRSVQKQQENLESYKQRLIDSGFSEKEAELAASKEIAPPNASEHNAGLALDILTADWWETHDDITADFDRTKEFRWLQENAHKYGFFMRYPKEYEDVTGYVYEPWHYRFIGVYYAEKITESGLPLEYFYKTNF